ncbi:hypothetical protein [Pseudomonas chlororaphis]|uniref:hypothetical protein n=1 Tax=Pseudomonas chlororaphis TaxID=587753 RepID=UPI0015DE82AE|nr:hypothetical protein [Pseudomonas chlororaphis]QLL16057.1 hypothetical protein H0I86_13615 [Pseudomonas chlororaphis subsp. aurantiaca]
MSSPLRTAAARRKLPLIIAGLLALAGCQTQAVTPAQPLAADDIQQQKMNSFARQFSGVLVRNAFAANGQGLVGSVDLKVKINRQNQVLSCEIRPNAQLAPVLALESLARQVCWDSLFPEMPAELFGSEGEQEIVAPMVFPILLDESTPERQRRLDAVEAYAQSRFFWTQTLGKQPVDSIGKAHVRFVANAQGQVQECLVNLDPVGERRDAFKLDSDLQARLTAQCKQMNLRQMPGFKVGDKGLARGNVLVEYAPWKGGPQHN